MEYGRHIDNPYMSSGRADLSFTIFLNCKNSYKGGELSIESFNAEEKLLPNVSPKEQYQFARNFLKVGDYTSAEKHLESLY